jgi:hypothetical protein
MTLLLAVTLAAACATARSAPTPGAPGAPSARRAALARLTVENQTGRRLTIAFRPTSPPENEIVVGDVAPGETSTMAPIPAGEPIVLSARSPEGETLQLAPRSFAVDEEWVWVIPRDARFTSGGNQR